MSDKVDPQPPSSTEETQQLPTLDVASELAAVLDGYLADLQAGRAPDRDQLLAAHPALAQQLEPCLAGIEFIHRAAKPQSNPTQLGDFRILRELGRGGMGVVYEAEQISLSRRVALKVLRFGAVADKEALERFRREAETVAHLHHTNIVPIFAVGSENGVSYYAMQYIQGGSLADKLSGCVNVVEALKTAPVAGPADSTAGEPVSRASNSASEVAGWGLEVAEALSHSHHRGVIHRDIKPSNLLLDKDGRVWLTDFGLARRMDEVTMTITGMVMGTPRYMSPEQAVSVKQPVDHRTDVYSLGATLYELVTGQPVFASDTPHGVISQILSAEPVRPRTIRHTIPRDLETIILKCLSKEASQRYSTAQALADDLRAFREGRPIKARRSSIAEVAVRWVQKRKKSVAIAAGAAAATLLIAAVVYGMLSSAATARLAHVFMRTEGEHYKVEVLDAEEKAVIATFTAPTQEAQSISPGKYCVRLSAEGRLSETSQLETAAGCYYDLTAALSPRNLWELPVQGAESSELARVEGRDDLFLTTAVQLRRVNGETGQPIWQASLQAADQPLIAAALKLESARSLPVFGAAGYGAEFKPLGLARPLVDLDGDGKADLIWASRTSDALLALSGKSGEVLWCHRSNPPPPVGITEKDIKARSAPNNATVAGQPLLAEVDGRNIVVAMFVSSGEPIRTNDDQWHYGGTSVWLEAVVAKTGESLWRRSLTLPNQDSWTKNFSCTAALGKQGKRQIGEMAYGNRLCSFDFLSGEPVSPEREIDDKPLLVVRIVDLEGTGQLDVLFVRETVTLGGKPVDDQKFYNQNEKRELTLVAQSAASKAPLWEHPLSGIINPLLNNSSIRTESFDWPLIADLEGQGKLAVVVPFIDSSERVAGLEVLDGKTGQSRWQRPLTTVSESTRPSQIDRFTVGPDLDGDGIRELFAASYAQQAYRIYIDALSGRDGHSLWNKTQQLHNWLDSGFTPLRWWQASADGQPQLVATFGNGGGKLHSLILASATGRVEHLLTAFGEPDIADLNGDGLPDLFAREPIYTGQGNQFTAGKLRAIKGTPPVAWRILNNEDLALRHDFNRDGIADLLSKAGNVAVSGRDGTALWRADLGPWGATGTISGPLPSADLNGDGSPDVVYATHGNIGGYATVAATSGCDGKPLWSTELKSEPHEFLYVANYMVPNLGCHIFEKGNPDVLFLYTTSGFDPANSSLYRSWMTRFSGRDGKLLWRIPLNEPNATATGNTALTVSVADLDGDGVNDIVFWMPLTEAAARAAVSKKQTEKENAAADNSQKPLLPMLELLAFSGRDGKLLWRRPGFFTQTSAGSSVQNLGRIPKPVVADLNGDGKPTVLITDVHWSGYNPNHQDSYAEVIALDGSDGRVEWSWRGDDGNSYDINSQWADASPQVVRTAAGPAVCVSIADQNLKLQVDPSTKAKNPSGKLGHQIVLLSPRGEVLHRTDTMNANWRGGRPRIWVADLDGDGHDELVWRDETQVRAMHADGEKLLWSWDVPQYPDGIARGDIRAILPAGADYPAVVAVCDKDALYGLSGPTGAKLWRCDSVDTMNSGLLDVNRPQGLPNMWTFGPGTVGSCFMALATSAAGRYLPLQPTTRTYNQPVDDPRTHRPLPWASRGPGGPSIDYGFGPRPGIAGALASFVLIAFVVGRRPGKKRRTIGILALWLIVTLIYTFLAVLKDSQLSNGMSDIEHYDLSGWYEIFLPGFEVAMWVLLIGVAVVKVYRLARWTLKRRATES